MTPPRPALLTAAWLGFSLAALLFYPLAATIEAEPYYLHWRPAHVAEAAIAWLIAGAGLTLLIMATWARTTRRATLALALGAVLPLLSVGAGLARQLSIDDPLWILWRRPFVPMLAAAVGVGLLVRWPGVVRVLTHAAVIVLSPIALVVVVTIAGSLRVVQTIATAAEPAASGARCASVVALLFDELSFDYLYDGRDIRDDFPRLKAFAAAATNHLAVRSPGDRTLVSVPGYLAAREFDDIHVMRDHLESEVNGTRQRFSATAPDGVFATAQQAGFATQAAGFYFPYCELLGPVVHSCRSFSFYNAGSVSRSFSPANAVLTTAVLWPSSMPHGLLRGPAHAHLQRLRVGETFSYATQPVDPATPTFRFVHFSVPHVPFVFTAEGYDPPLDPLRTSDAAYLAQLRYTDRLFGELLDRLKEAGALDRTTVAVFSDHGYLAAERRGDNRHVPFIVRTAGQDARVDVERAERGESLLKALVERCAA